MREHLCVHTQAAAGAGMAGSGQMWRGGGGGGGGMGMPYRVCGNGRMDGWMARGR
jgi:hypothetical protein